MAGEDIVSTMPKNGQFYKSGTSFAAPHVAATLAIYIGFEGIKNDVNKAYLRLSQNAQKGLFPEFVPPYAQAAMVNHGMLHPDKDPRLPYNGPDGKELTDYFDGQNDFAEPLLTFDGDAVGAEPVPEPGAPQPDTTTTQIVIVPVTPVPLPPKA